MVIKTVGSLFLLFVWQHVNFETSRSCWHITTNLACIRTCYWQSHWKSLVPFFWWFRPTLAEFLVGFQCLDSFENQVTVSALTLWFWCWEGCRASTLLAELLVNCKSSFVLANLSKSITMMSSTSQPNFQKTYRIQIFPVKYYQIPITFYQNPVRCLT